MPLQITLAGHLSQMTCPVSSVLFKQKEVLFKNKLNDRNNEQYFAVLLTVLSNSNVFVGCDVLFMHIILAIRIRNTFKLEFVIFQSCENVKSFSLERSLTVFNFRFEMF